MRIRAAIGYARLLGRSLKVAAPWVALKSVQAAEKAAQRRFAHNFCLPLVTYNLDRGDTQVNLQNFTKYKRHSTNNLAVRFWPQCEPVKPGRVKFWAEEAVKDELGEGYLHLCSHALGESLTQEDQRAIRGLILDQKIHTLSLPKRVFVSDIEKLLGIVAHLNKGRLPNINWLSGEKSADLSEEYDLSRQSFTLKELIQTLTKCEELKFIDIYNTPLDSENIELLSQFISKNAEELTFFLNIKPTDLDRFSYNSIEYLINPCSVRIEMVEEGES